MNEPSGRANDNEVPTSDRPPVYPNGNVAPPGIVYTSYPKPKPPTALIVAAVAVTVILIVAATVLAVQATPGHNNGSASKQIVNDGDYIIYQLSGTSDGAPVSGTVRSTFSNIINGSLLLTSSSNSSAYQGFEKTFYYDTSNGIWKCSGLTGSVLNDPSLKVGSESMNTSFGTKQVDHYRMNLSGIVYDIYVAQGSGIPFKYTTSNGTDTISMTLVDTNMGWIKAL